MAIFLAAEASTVMKDLSPSSSPFLPKLDEPQQKEIPPTQYEDLLRQAGVGILILDASGNFADLNEKACDVLGYTRDRLLGRSIDEILSAKLRRRKDELVERLEREDSYLLELPLVRFGGEPMFVELNVSRVVTGGDILYLGIFRDVSARKQMEKEARRRNKELFVLNSIAHVISKSLDPQEVLSNGLDHVLRLLDIEAGYILVHNTETGTLEIAVHQGLSPEFVRDYSHRPLRVGESITGQVLVTGKPVLSHDASTDPRVTRDVVKKDAIKSSLNIPLRAKDHILGVLMVASFGIREFSSWDIDVLTTIGNEIGVALENSRLYHDLEQRSHEILTLLHVSNELNRRLEPDRLIELVSEKARELVPSRRAAAAFAENGHVDCCLMPDRKRMTLPVPCLTDLEQPAYNEPPRLLRGTPPQSVMSVPMLDSDRHPLGLIELYDRDDRDGFTSKDADLIAALAAQASIAFEKSRLFKETEREMEFVADIVDNMASGLIVTDNSGLIRRINLRACEMLLLDEKSLRGKPIEQWLDTRRENLNTVEIPCSFQAELKREGKGTLPVNVLASRQVDDTGSPIGTILVLEDLEQLRRLKRKEQERERLATLGEVATGIAHEIRNPLFGISSVAQILRMEAATEDEHRPLLDAMLAEIERINGMVEELLLYGRPQSLHLGEVDLALIWNSITLLAASEIESHQQQVERPNRSDAPSIVADAEKLRQVFLNLLKNAIEATPPRGKIYIEIEPKNDSRRQGVEIQVKDTGSGIAPDDRERIFDLFYSRKRGGSGLGLPICKKIIENHGGHIRVESILGKGTNARVWLPVQQEPRS